MAKWIVWLEFENGSLLSAKFDTDYNGVAEGTNEYRYGVIVLSRLHPNGGPVEREEKYANGMLREVYSVAPDGKKKLIHQYDQVGREVSKALPKN